MATVVCVLGHGQGSVRPCLTGGHVLPGSVPGESVIKGGGGEPMSFFRGKPDADLSQTRFQNLADYQDPFLPLLRKGIRGKMGKAKGYRV